MESFPSLTLCAGLVEASGPFAEAQRAYLEPDAATVQRFTALAEQAEVAVVAHYYMGPDLQGVLAASSWPEVEVADSLRMGDAALEMVERGAKAVVVLGVDFMSESVRAVLNRAGHAHVPVYRVSDQAIGCSLAEAAEQPAYTRFVEQAAREVAPLHVIYVNTSLGVKARAEAVVPTITCTSSNVVRTVLQAFAQVPDLTVWFGPDTYMGANLMFYFKELARMDDQVIGALHPQHSQATIAKLIDRFHFFQHGTCLVHHMFGKSVAERIERDYSDAMLTAHLEVPGEMFALGLRAQQAGRGVVGSTSDILRFVTRRVETALTHGEREPLRFVLGTEAGMASAIVGRVRDLLASQGDSELQVQIILPIATEAVSPTTVSGLALQPGTPASEGCSAAGGCATCPYMKMNSVDGLLSVMDALAAAEPSRLQTFLPPQLQACLPPQGAERVAGRDALELAGDTIARMRSLNATGQLPVELVRRIEDKRRAA